MRSYLEVSLISKEINEKFKGLPTCVILVVCTYTPIKLKGRGDILFLVSYPSV